MIAALLVLLSVYFAIRILRRHCSDESLFSIGGTRAAMVELFQNLQSTYRKWEEKAQPNLHSLYQKQKNIESILTSNYENDDKPNKNNNNRKLSPSQNGGGGDVINRSSNQRRISPGINVPNNTAWASRKNRFRIPTFNLPQWDRLSQFKTSPSMTSEGLGSMRPSMGPCCPRCVPTSRLAFHDDPNSTLGISNVLNVSTQNRDNGILIRTFHHLSFLIKKSMGYLYPDVSFKVLKCDRVCQAIDKAVEDEMEDAEIDEIDDMQLTAIKAKHTKRAVETLRRMRSCISSSLLKLAGWVLYKLLGRMLTGIHVQKGDIENLRKISKRNLPLIYLPLHRSHLDYILLTFILYINDLKAPVIAAGDNLLIPFFGALMRGLGAFFIKRKLDTRTGRKDHVYRAVLHSYMVESLKANHSLEFFIEGGRSRTGKACMPKAGLLSVVVDSILDGSVEDAYVVPVGISYEKILDGNFVMEQLGKPKVVENFTVAVRAIWRTLHSNFGNVRVDFCQPFSIKEFLQAAQRRHNIVAPPTSNRLTPLTSHDNQSKLAVSRKSSNTSLYGLDVVTEDNREVITDLAKHIIYDATNSSALMSTNLLAFLLLTKHRKGGTLQQLSRSMSWLKDELSSRQRDVGFQGDASEAVKHAWSLLGKELVATETVQMEWSSLETEASNNVKITFYKPVVRLPHVLELQYYANSAVSPFLMESVVVNAIFAELDDEINPWRGCKSQVTVSCNGLVQKALNLCDILQYEFVFAPPCINLSSVIVDTIELLVTKDLLQPTEDVSSLVHKRAWANRHEFDYNSSDEEDGLMVAPPVLDQKFKLNLSEESLNKLQFLRCILSPFVEPYWVAACSLLKLVNAQKEESELFRDVQKTAEERLHKGLLTYEESFACEPLKNSLKLFSVWNVIETHVEDSIKLVYLQNDYDNTDSIQRVIQRIEDFRK